MEVLVDVDDDESDEEDEEDSTGGGISSSSSLLGFCSCDIMITCSWQLKTTFFELFDGLICFFKWSIETFKCENQQ